MEKEIKLTKLFLKEKTEFWYDVTNMVKELIGENVVEFASIKVLEDDISVPPLESLDIACRAANTIRVEYEKKKVLRFDSTSLKIKFIGGETIIFSNSSFGCMSLVENK